MFLFLFSFVLFLSIILQVIILWVILSLMFYHDCFCDHTFIIKTSPVSVLRLSSSSSPLSFQYSSVRPSLFTLEATPMPVEFNTNFKGICTVNEIRPEPSEFYWMLGDTRIQGLSNSSVVNSTYDVLSVYSTVTHIAIVDDFDKTLTCVLVMQNGGELRRSMQIVVNHGMYIMIYHSIIHLCGMRIVYHFLILTHGQIYKRVQNTTYERFVMPYA